MRNAGIYEFRKVRLFKHLYDVILCMNGISLKDKEKYMYWVVEERMVCPRTGTIFIHVLTVKNLRLIIWFKGDYFISPGSVLVTGPFGIAVDGRLRQLHILRAFPYTPPFGHHFWRTRRARAITAPCSPAANIARIVCSLCALMVL